jgi:S1-C subfamily serine protease
VKGVMVTDIDPASIMGKLPSSLKTGDVIEEINHQPVASIADFEQLAQQLAPGLQQTLFFICRGKVRSYVIVTSH